MKDERQFANSKGGETRLSRACAVGSDSKSLTVEFVLPPSLAAGLAVRYQPRVVRSPAAHAPGVRSGRSCHTQPTRQREVSRTASRRLRSVFAYAPTAARWRGLPPAACSARPTPTSGLLEALSGARGQRASRPASGAHPTRGRPVCCRHALVRARPVHQPARAAKAPRGRHSDSHRKPPATPPTAPQPPRCSSTGVRHRAVIDPLETEPHLLHPQPQTGS